MVTTHIYALIDPRTDIIRYIGKSDDPHRRLSEHLSLLSSTYKARWLAQLAAAGLLPEIRVLEECVVGAWEERERWWIKLGRLIWPLTNATAGGEGAASQPLSELHKTRIGQARKGHKASALTKARISRAKLGKKTPDAHSKYYGVSFNKGKWQASFKYRGAAVYIGTYSTQEQAALAYNTYISTHNIDRPLNQGVADVMVQ